MPAHSMVNPLDVGLWPSPSPLWGYLGRKWSGFMGLAEGVALKCCIDEGYA